MLSERALASDKLNHSTHIDLKKIYVSSEFNCRGPIMATEIMELTSDVALRGLMQPIIIRPLWATEDALSAKGFEYFLVAGFRRYAAYKSNKAETIPCIVNLSLKTDFDCHDLNAIENLQRTDLNLFQEARAIRQYWIENWSRSDIAIRISKSTGWVQIRLMVLQLPEEIQRSIAQGYIKQTEVRKIYELRNEPDEMMKAAGRIASARKHGGKFDVDEIIPHIKRKEKHSDKRVRGKTEMFNLMERIRNFSALINSSIIVKAEEFISSQGNSVLTRLIAWQMGEISTGELEVELSDFFELFDVEYLSETTKELVP